MYPYLLESWIGSRVLIPTYGVLLAFAFTAAYLESIRRALTVQENPKHIERIFLLVVLGSLFGARLFHVGFEELAYYRENPKQVLAIWEGGFTFYGGLLISIALIYAYVRHQKLSFFRIMDIITPSLFLGLAIGRLGCLAAGCCWGKSTSVPWAVTYSHLHTLSAIRYVPVHPVQLYEALAALGIFVWLFRRSRRSPAEGSTFLVGLVSYGILRFVVEVYRGDEYRGLIFGGYLSLAQFFSLIVIALGCLAMKLRLSERSPSLS